MIAQIDSVHSPGTTPDGQIGFGVLGPLQMHIGGSEVSVGTPKQRAVLAMLVFNRNRAVSVESLINAVWPESAPEGARATLHSYVSNLRRLIGTANVDPKTVLAGVPPGYRLAVNDMQTDLGRFAAQTHEGIRAAAARRFEDASLHLGAALAEWRGPVLEDLSDFDFVDPLAQALAEDKIIAHTAHAEAEIACGRAASVIAELEALIIDHPYREPLWAQLITAYYLNERQSDALDAYQRLRAVLADDLGIDPGPTLRGLYQRILRQEPLDVRDAAQAAAEDTIHAMDHDGLVRLSGAASLRDVDGSVYPLTGMATRIGRSPDNDVVLADAKVSRHHAVINDTGNSFVITDLGSANGVHVDGQHIRATAVLSDGDVIRIGEHQLTFQTGHATSPGADV
jgi:DNA-binding SARP family transcriptional activator